MSLAKKILNKTVKVEEKVQSQFFDEADAFGETASKAMKASQDKDFSDILRSIIMLMSELDSVDEKGAIKQLDKIKGIIKSKKIEEGKISKEKISEAGSKHAKAALATIDHISEFVSGKSSAFSVDEIDEMDEDEINDFANEFLSAGEKLEKLAKSFK